MFTRLFKITSEEPFTLEAVNTIANSAIGNATHITIDELITSGDISTYKATQVSSTEIVVESTHPNKEALDKFVNTLQPAADAVEANFNVTIDIQES